jgi:hypothetical protein
MKVAILDDYYFDTLRKLSCFVKLRSCPRSCGNLKMAHSPGC